MEFSKKLTGLISSLYRKPEFSDIDISLQNGSKIPGHKLILYVRNNSWGLDDFINADCLDLSMYPVNTIMKLLKWVYTDQLDIDGDDVSFESLTQLISVAKFFNLQSLYTRCETALHVVQDVKKYEIVNLDVDINVESREDSRDIGISILEGSPQSHSKISDADIIGTKSMVTRPTQPAVAKVTAVKTKPESQNAEIRTQKFTKNKEIDISAVTMNTVVEKLPVTMDTTVVSDEGEKSNSDSEAMESENDDSDEVFMVGSFSAKSSRGLRLSASNRFTCLICGKTFKNKGHLADHVTTHTGVKPFNCDVCGNSFNRQSSLVRHQKIHMNERTYFCEICGKSFVDRSSLHKHKKIHLNIKNYVCKICSWKFTDASNLNRHVRCHTGEKNYPCTECNLRFRDPYTLNRHSVIHENKHKFSCHLCRSSFRKLKQLQNHLVTCGKALNQK